MEKNVMRINDTRIIAINGEITDELCTQACINLLQMENENQNEDITILLNSPGGSVHAGFMLIDTIRILNTDVEIICTGLAASMGAMILMAGTQGKRRALPHAKVMLHQPLGGSSSIMQVSDFEIQVGELKRTRDEIFGFISECTGKTNEEVAARCDRNFWMNVSEAMEFGIIDSIVTKDSR